MQRWCARSRGDSARREKRSRRVSRRWRGGDRGRRGRRSCPARGTRRSGCRRRSARRRDRRGGRWWSRRARPRGRALLTSLEPLGLRLFSVGGLPGDRRDLDQPPRDAPAHRARGWHAPAAERPAADAHRLPAVPGRRSRQGLLARRGRADRRRLPILSNARTEESAPAPARAGGSSRRPHPTGVAARAPRTARR